MVSHEMHVRDLQGERMVVAIYTSVRMLGDDN